MAKDKKESSKKEAVAPSTKKAQMLVDIKALPVAERKMTGSKTTDLIKLDDVLRVIEDSDI